MTKLRNILKKKIILLTLLPVAVFISIFVIYFVLKKENDKKIETPETIEEVPEESTGPEEIVENTEITKDWNVYTNDNLGVSFKYPKDWVVEQTKISECNIYKAEPDYCLRILTPDKKNRMEIKIESILNYSGSGNVRKKEFLSGKLLTINSNISLFRSNKVNGLYDYENKMNLVLSYVQNTYPDPIDDGFGDPIHAEKSIWYVNSNIGYTFTYLTDPALIPDRNNIGENEVVDTMDQIMSTLEIDFNVNPF